MTTTLEAFQKMTFVAPVPKQSAQARYKAFGTEVTTKAMKAHAALCKAFTPDSKEEFMELEYIAPCVVDQSLIAYLRNNHVVIDCAGNQALAVVGDAFLSLSLAKQLMTNMVRGVTAQQMQKAREIATCEASLVRFYDHVFGASGDVIAAWRDANAPAVPTARQKAQFVEAILGSLAIHDMEWAGNMVCQKIFELAGSLV